MLCVVLVFSFSTGRMYHVPSTSCIMFLQHDLRHDAFLVCNLGYVFNLRDVICNDSQYDASVMFSQHIDIMFAQHNLRHVAFLVCNLGYVLALRDEMRTDFWTWETYYAKCVKNVSEIRNIMWYALPCVNSTGLFSWVYGSIIVHMLEPYVTVPL